MGREFSERKQLDNFWAHVTLTAMGCQEDGQLFKAVTKSLVLPTDTASKG
jgi:hypothetical protein